MRLLFAVVVCALSGCAGFKAVERGDWRLVYADGAKRSFDAARDVITRDAYEAEVAESNGRGWEPPPGYVFPLLHEVDAIGLKVGEVQGFRVDEATEAELFVDGAGLDVYWGPVQRIDGWKGDIDVTVRESKLYLKGTRAGAAKLKLVRGNATTEVPVTVK